jgi:DNA modification methylase
MIADVLAGRRRWAVVETDVLAGLRAMPDESVNCVVTSPPYWGLRDYGTASWKGGSPDCDHKATRIAEPKMALPPIIPVNTGDCQRCGAVRVDKQLGLEPTVDEYVAKMVEVFREVRRVLRKDGVAFLNLGDAYAGSWGAQSRPNGTDKGSTIEGGSMLSARQIQAHPKTTQTGSSKRTPGIKPKDLIGLPWMVAFALRADGYYLRSAITWCKKACMPECLAPETRVFVRVDGLVKQVTLDDVAEAGLPYPEILTPTGWRPIEAAWEVVKDEAVAFDAAKVASVVCSREHLWPVSHDRRRTVVHEKPTCNLRDTGYADYLLHHTIDQWLEDTPRQIDGQDADAELGWLLGLYAAEGGFGEVRGHRCKFTMHADETAVLDRAQEIAERRFGAAVSRRTIKNYAQMRFASEAWRRLASFVVPGKATTKTLNLSVVLNTPREFRQGLWDGYLAGDGSARSAGVTAVSASRALRDAVAVLASSIGIVTSKGDYRDPDARTGRTYTGYQLWTPYLRHRQQKKASTARQITIRRKRIIPGPHRMIDLTVEGGLFLIEDGLVTHNSVTDRPTSATEMVFLLTRSPRYFYDSEAVKEPAESRAAWVPDSDKQGVTGMEAMSTPSGRRYTGFNGRWNESVRNGTAPTGRNLRNYWELGPEPYAAAHYAVFPTEIPRRAILAGCPPDGVVLDPFCGSGTAVMVALRHGRRGIGIELSPAYAEMARNRIVGDCPMWNSEDGAPVVAEAEPVADKQAAVGKRTYVGFNARWKAKQAALLPEAGG